MDRNALRRKKYAEMPPAKKAEFLRSLREARAAKKKQSLSFPCAQQILPSCVESSICLTYNHDKPSETHNYIRVLSNALQNGECLVSVNSVITDARHLPCIPSPVSNPSNHHVSSSSRKKIASSNAPFRNKCIPFFSVFLFFYLVWAFLLHIILAFLHSY